MRPRSLILGGPGADDLTMLNTLIYILIVVLIIFAIVAIVRRL